MELTNVQILAKLAYMLMEVRNGRIEPDDFERCLDSIWDQGFSSLPEDKRKEHDEIAREAEQEAAQ